MFDWTNIFNIAFVASIGGLSLFFLVSTIAVAAKGKRKCNAFDVILRILSSLCFVAAILVIGCAVLSTLDGELCIRFAQNAAGGPLVPTLAFFGKDIVLPLADLFLIFSTAIGVVIGFACAAALFVLSLMALIVDCLVANQKVKKDKKVKAQKAAAKTPEQIKREKELERIKKIGESAVQKTAKAADKQAEKSEQTSIEPQSEPEQQPSDDWREQPKDEPAEFVGIKDNTENEFDTFDDIPESADEEPVQDEHTEETEQLVEEADEFVDEQPVEDGFVEEQPIDETDEVIDEQTEDEVPVQEFDENEEYGDEPVVEQTEEVTDEQPIGEAPEELDEQPIEEEPEEQVAATAEHEEPVEQVADEVAPVQDTNEDDRVWNEPADDEVEEQPSDEAPAEKVAADENVPDYGDIEPDRDIYIPEIRTIVKTDEDTEKEPAPVKKSASAKKPAASRSSSAGARSTARGGQRSTGAKTATRTPRSGGGSSGAAAKRTPQTATEQPEEKKLPVTRRYVILDRRNAVNMFGEYLRERNKADKEKLQSSINTIIIE